MSFIVAHLWMALTFYRLLFTPSGIPIATGENAFLFAQLFLDLEAAGSRARNA